MTEPQLNSHHGTRIDSMGLPETLGLRLDTSAEPPAYAVDDRYAWYYS